MGEKVEWDRWERLDPAIQMKTIQDHSWLYYLFDLLTELQYRPAEPVLRRIVKEDYLKLGYRAQRSLIAVTDWDTALALFKKWKSKDYALEAQLRALLRYHPPGGFPLLLEYRKSKDSELSSVARDVLSDELAQLRHQENKESLKEIEPLIWLVFGLVAELRESTIDSLESFKTFTLNFGPGKLMILLGCLMLEFFMVAGIFGGAKKVKEQKAASRAAASERRRR